MRSACAHTLLFLASHDMLSVTGKPTLSQMPVWGMCKRPGV